MLGKCCNFMRKYVWQVETRPFYKGTQNNVFVKHANLMDCKICFGFVYFKNQKPDVLKFM